MRIGLTQRTAAYLDAPVRRALVDENAYRRRNGLTPLVNLSRESVQSLLQVGPERAAKLSRLGVYTIGDFTKLNSDLVPAFLLGAQAAMRAERR
ncbi:MAG: hypothetical protein ACAI38_25475 [Myxococcota bacterium]